MKKFPSKHISVPSNPIINGSIAALLTFSAAFNTTGIADGVRQCKILASEENPVLLEFFAEVITAFDAETTNVLTVGSDATATQFLGSGDITEGTPGFYPASNANKKYRVTADTDIYIKYASTGVLQVATATVVEDTPGTLTAGNATLTFTSVKTGELEISVALATNDSQNAVATKFRAALNANATFAAHYIASGATNAVVITELVAADNDATMNLAYADDTSAGLTDDATSTATTAGTALATAGEALIYVRVTPLAPSPSGYLT